MRILSLLSLLILASVSAHAEIRTETVEYRDGDTVLEGLIAYDSKSAAKRPGVVIVHDWHGVGDQVRASATELAKLGYTAFVADIYGKGVRPKDAQSAGAESGKYKDNRQLLRRRASLALDELKKHKTVDSNRLGAMGYCFGGTTSLEMARAGLPLKGVVSFHGNLDTTVPADAKSLKAQVLVLHGAADPFVPDEQVKAFVDEMNKAKATWELVSYSGAVHSFTKKAAGNDPSKGQAYNARADKRSWVAMTSFFEDVFKK